MQWVGIAGTLPTCDGVVAICISDLGHGDGHGAKGLCTRPCGSCFTLDADDNFIILFGPLHRVRDIVESVDVPCIQLRRKGENGIRQKKLGVPLKADDKRHRYPGAVQSNER